jgi:hypothetical protein
VHGEREREKGRVGGDQVRNARGVFIAMPASARTRQAEKEGRDIRERWIDNVVVRIQG